MAASKSKSSSSKSPQSSIPTLEFLLAQVSKKSDQLFEAQGYYPGPSQSHNDQYHAWANSASPQKLHEGLIALQKKLGYPRLEAWTPEPSLAEQQTPSITTTISAPQGLDAFAPPNSTPLLHRLCNQGAYHWTEIYLKAYLAQGGSVDVLDAQGKTPLMATLSHPGKAASLGPHGRESLLKTARLLIAHGASLDRVDSLGRSLFHKAALFQFTDVMISCVKQGIDLNAVEPGMHYTPLMAYLTTAFSSAPKLITKKVATPIIKMAEYLLDQGASVHVKSKWGDSLGHFLIELHSSRSNALTIPLFKLFVKHGFEINTLNTKGRTVLLDYIIRTNLPLKDKKELILFLVDSGCDPFLKDPQGLFAFNPESLSAHYKAGTDEDKHLLTEIFSFYEHKVIAGALNTPAISSELAAVKKQARRL